MDLELLTDEYDLEGLQSDWNRLAAEVPLHSWEWMSSWWSAYGHAHRLAVIVCRDGADVIGIAPWFLHQGVWGSRLRYLGSGKVCTDYARVLAAAGHQQSVQQAIADFLSNAILHRHDLRLSHVQRIEMEGVCHSASATRWLEEEWKRAGFVLRNRQQESSWRIELHGDWDQLLSQLSQNWRRKARKAKHRLDSGEVRFHSANGREQLRPALDILKHLHSRRRMGKGQRSCFHDPRFEYFIDDVVDRFSDREWVQIQWCEHQAEPIAAHIQFLSPTTVYMYQTGMEPDYGWLEPGHTMLAAALLDAMNHRRNYFDLLRGNEPYKAGWAGKEIPLSKLTFIAPTAAARLHDTCEQAARKFKDAAQAFLEDARG